MITITRVQYNIYLQLLQPHNDNNNNNKIYFRNAAIYTKIHLCLVFTLSDHYTCEMIIIYNIFTGRNVLLYAYYRYIVVPIIIETWFEYSTIIIRYIMLTTGAGNYRRDSALKGYYFTRESNGH